MLIISIKKWIEKEIDFIMEHNVAFREYRKQDAPFLEDIIRNTWEYDSFCSPKVAKQMARLYLASCLVEQDYAKVALIDNKPVGIIMAKNITKHKNSFRFLYNQLIRAIPLYLSKEGRKTAKIFLEINNIDLKLLSEQHKNYDGEIAFFAINEQCRGLGIGKSLFDMALEYFESQQIKSYFLYTDSSCNYGFYEHQGMVRCGETTHQFTMKNVIKFYLYERTVSE